MQDYEQRLGDELSNIATRIIGDILQGLVKFVRVSQIESGNSDKYKVLKYLYNVERLQIIP